MTIPTENVFSDIASAIREKDGTAEDMAISEMAGRIRAIPTGGGGDDPPEEWEIDPDKINLLVDIPGPNVKFILTARGTVTNPYSIDWGDGTVDADIYYSNDAGHEYLNAGRYTIKIWGNPGQFYLAASSSAMFIKIDYPAPYGNIVNTLVIKAYIPSTVNQLPGYLFAKHMKLEYCEIHKPLTGSMYGVFQYCHKLNKIKIPNDSTGLGRYLFQNSDIQEIDCSDFTTIPSLYDFYVFDYTPTFREIIVPDELRDEWRSSTNWGSGNNNIYMSIVKKSESRKYGGSA